MSQKIKSASWGTGVVDNLVNFSKKMQPDLKGYTRRSIYRMVQFYEIYSTDEFVSALPTQIESFEKQTNMVMTAIPTQLPYTNKIQILSVLILINWSSHIEIFSACKTHEERIFYCQLNQSSDKTCRMYQSA